MKKYLIATTATLALVGSIPVAVAADAVVYEPVPETVAYVPTHNFYASIFGGAAFPHDMEFDATTGDVDLDLDTGFVVGATAGYRFGRVRGELEVSYQRFDADDISVGPVDADVDGDVNAVYILGNAWVDLFAYRGVGVYAGGGVGAAYIDVDFDVPGFGVGTDDSDWTVAGQLGAGLTYDVNERVSIDLGYRFKATGDVDFVDSDGDTAENGNLYTHNVQLGIAVKF
ncbi:outer membrane protein [Notoacmeibacter sp. MSK16QG-6]|uniref:outer membrane protein n=1 Tax=Notoacmeibacter sp. MSK16QG-6 TaxID=2957982 RepID=UPI00209E153C|nr:outer membrane beta-barrel protein [Notoacmeibacter sp. MSK16QG-6]MCP1199854.1 outer membrane beta-barrel protein [Notoacmeibacter sp. MSK16QG-6]